MLYMQVFLSSDNRWFIFISRTHRRPLASRVVNQSKLGRLLASMGRQHPHKPHTIIIQDIITSTFGSQIHINKPIQWGLVNPLKKKPRKPAGIRSIKRKSCGYNQKNIFCGCTRMIKGRDRLGSIKLDRPCVDYRHHPVPLKIHAAPAPQLAPRSRSRHCRLLHTPTQSGCPPVHM